MLRNVDNLSPATVVLNIDLAPATAQKEATFRAHGAFGGIRGNGVWRQQPFLSRAMALQLPDGCAKAAFDRKGVLCLQAEVASTIVNRGVNDGQCGCKGNKAASRGRKLRPNAAGFIATPRVSLVGAVVEV